MGKQPRLYARTYAESLGCEKTDSSEQVGLLLLLLLLLQVVLSCFNKSPYRSSRSYVPCLLENFSRVLILLVAGLTWWVGGGDELTGIQTYLHLKTPGNYLI